MERPDEPNQAAAEAVRAAQSAAASGVSSTGRPVAIVGEFDTEAEAQRIASVLAKFEIPSATVPASNLDPSLVFVDRPPRSTVITPRTHAEAAREALETEARSSDQVRSEVPRVWRTSSLSRRGRPGKEVLRKVTPLTALEVDRRPLDDVSGGLATVLPEQGFVQELGRGAMGIVVLTAGELQ